MEKKVVALIDPRRDWAEHIKHGLEQRGYEVVAYTNKSFQPEKVTERLTAIVFFTSAIDDDLALLIQQARKNQGTRYASRFVIAENLSLNDFRNKALANASIWKRNLHDWAQAVEHVEALFKSQKDSSSTVAPETGLDSTDEALLSELARTQVEKYSVEKKSKRFIVPGIGAFLVIVLGALDWFSSGQPNFWYLVPICILLGIAVGPSSMNDDWEKVLTMKAYLAEHDPSYAAKSFEYDFGKYYTDSRFDYSIYRLAQVSAVLITIPVLIGGVIWGVTGIASLAPATIIIALLIIIIVILLNQRRS